MSKEKVQALLRPIGINNFTRMASAIYNGTDKSLCLYLIQVGLETTAAKIRATARREIRHNVLKPASAQRPGATKYSVKYTPREIKKLMETTMNMFHTWQIGDMRLGDATRSDLLSAARAERASGHGHVRNAVFYETLAMPMKADDSENAAQHWRDVKAVMLIKDEIWKDTERKEITFVDRTAFAPAPL